MKKINSQKNFIDAKKHSKSQQPKHFLDIDEIDIEELQKIIKIAKDLKKKNNLVSQAKMLAHKNLAMIFEKNSTRTRISFEVAINQLGGNAIVVNKNDTQLGKGETIYDTAKVLSRYVDAIMIRTNSHQSIVELAENSTVPVINALSDFSHPCQILASILTIEEKLGSISGKKLAWSGDQNNVLNSYIHGACAFDYELSIASPAQLNFSSEEIKKAQKKGANISYFIDPKKAAKNADVLITDTWISMGEEAEKDSQTRKKKIDLLTPYQVNSDLIKFAKKGAIFTHCLPAYRGFEVSSDVIDSECSIVFDEVENRLHIQKAILLWLIGKKI